jgi:curved DNA-binding protein CbpA
MRRIIENRKLFGVTSEADLAQLKTIYRNLMKEWHPDKIQDDDARRAEFDLKSKEIIEAYHFLVSISPETHKSNLEEYMRITENLVIEDFSHKGQTLKIVFQDNLVYEYFGVPRGVYIKLVNSPTQARFARRHIFYSYTYRNVSKQTTE